MVGRVIAIDADYRYLRFNLCAHTHARTHTCCTLQVHIDKHTHTTINNDGNGIDKSTHYYGNYLI